MKPTHIPRTLIILSLTAVVVTFLAGVLHAFDTARAAPVTPAGLANRPAGSDKEVTPTPAPTPVPVSGDTNGIIALALVIVVIVLIGAMLGTNRPIKKKTP